MLWTFSDGILSSYPCAQAERVELGEEVALDFVASALQAGVEEWNHCIRALQAKLENKEEVLKLLNDIFQDSDSLEETVEEIEKRLRELKPIQIRNSDGGLKRLAFKYLLRETHSYKTMPKKSKSGIYINKHVG